MHLFLFLLPSFHYLMLFYCQRQNDYDIICIITLDLLFVWHRATNGISPLVSSNLFSVHNKRTSIRLHSIKTSTSHIHLHNLTWKRDCERTIQLLRRLLLPIQRCNLIIQVVIQLPVPQGCKTCRLMGIINIINYSSLLFITIHFFFKIS